MDIALIAVAGCAVSLLCVGLLAVGALLLLRFAGTTGVRWLDQLVGSDERLIEDEASPVRRRAQPRPSASLRASTPDLDFEEAVRRQQQQRNIPTSSSLRQANRPEAQDWGTDAPNLRSASQRRTRGERDHEILDDQDF